MKKWKIEFWDRGGKKGPVEKWFDTLTKEQLKAVAKEINMLKKNGNRLKLPHSKALGKGLFELRERRYGFRVYYGFEGECIIILLAAGNKKSQ